MSDADPECPFRVGDMVVFTPSHRTMGLYHDVSRFGIEPGESVRIAEIRDGTYLYFENGRGGWPWTEFTGEPSD